MTEIIDVIKETAEILEEKVSIQEELREKRKQYSDLIEEIDAELNKTDSIFQRVKSDAFDKIVSILASETENEDSGENPDSEI